MKKLTLLGLIFSLLCCFPNDFFAQSGPAGHINIANMGGDGFNQSCLEFDPEHCTFSGYEIEINVANLSQFTNLAGTILWPTTSQGFGFSNTPPNLYLRYTIAGYTSSEILVQNFVQLNTDVYQATIPIADLPSTYFCGAGDNTVNFDLGITFLQKMPNNTYAYYPMEDFIGTGDIFDCDIIAGPCHHINSHFQQFNFNVCCGDCAVGFRGDDQNMTMHSIEKEVDWSISPNPFDTQMELRYNLNEVSDVTIQLFNLSGQSLYESNKQQLVGDQFDRIDTAHLPKGVYFIHLQTAGQRFTQKLVKQ